MYVFKASFFKKVLQIDSDVLAQTVKPLRAKKGIDNDCRKKRLKKQKTSNKKVLNTFIWGCTTLKYHNCRFEKTQSTSNSNENNHNLLLFAFKLRCFAFIIK